MKYYCNLQLLFALLQFALLFHTFRGEHTRASTDVNVPALTGGHPMANTHQLLGIVVEETMGNGCSKDDVVVYQGATEPLPNGIPTYTVQILNTCISGCAVTNIHLSCGWFSSARLVNPRVFRRLAFDDCLVNDGGPLAPGQSLSFQYANTYSYPLAVASVSCA